MLDSADALVKLAVKASDPYVAAAVHELATGPSKRQLEEQFLGTRRTALALARWEHTPASVLEALSSMRDDIIGLMLDKNPNTASGVLSNLYIDASNKGSRDLTKLIAQHRNSEAGVLKKIAQSTGDAEVLLALSKNPAANAEVLTCLSTRKISDELTVALDKNIAQNISASADLLGQIYERSDLHTQVAILGHVNCPDSLIAAALDSEDVLGMRTLAKNKTVTVEVLRRYTSVDDVGVRCGVAANTGTSVSFIKDLVNDESSLVRREIASRQDLLPMHIVKLMEDSDYWVRQRLARNAVAPSDVLRALAVDKQADVRRAVARNIKCTVDLLKVLAADKNAWVRSAVAYQPNSPRWLLDELATDDNVDVLSGVANNANTAQKTLERLVESKDADVRRGVILNKAATRNTLLPLLEDPYYLHRILMVANPNMHEIDKWNLRDDPDYQVRFSVYRWAVKNIAPINTRSIVSNEVIRRRRV